ncbi:Capsule assembly protein Wzi [Belliella buryatensis]|uniref:Capsule assembly protein Wzi n=1 Tax=Belliella buryatensis TaxID=1500549 RepID=A0A239CUH5_9BACT|nr:capsule assembly Wzi family protein [Belliella buryatensis]SNS23438.1 Capsule assembly protein Wzi [Belliella buryatensis]
MFYLVFRSRTVLFSAIAFFCSFQIIKAQNASTNNNKFYELNRLNQLNTDTSNNFLQNNAYQVLPENVDQIISRKGAFFKEVLPYKVSFLPITLLSQYSSKTIYPEVSRNINNLGFQSYASAGLFASLGPLSIQLQPEFIYAQNKAFKIGSQKSSNTEYLERFGEKAYQTFLPGQSSIRLNAGAFSIGASTENIWWGPGQFNSLLFSNNAFGFEHLTLNTRRPAKTLLGTFEGQVIMGRLEGSGLESPLSNLLNDDWRYLNGINLVYGPKWIPGFFVGFSRMFQQYSETRGDTFRDFFPIFAGFQKERLLEDFDNPRDFDRAGRDQQLTGYVRYLNTKAKVELYFEYGRRDHALNWREATLNPEHARAYLFGFNKLFDIPNNAQFQVRGEVLQQQESINILIRYPGTGGGQNWGGHSPVRHGFTHLGQMLGPGVGPSSNVQTLEGAWVKGFKKLGVRLERLNRHQDIYQKRFLDPSEQGRWVDLSARLLADWQFDNLIISSNINFVNSLNYQWQLAPDSTPEYPRGENLFSIHSQVSLIYLFNKK